MCCIFAISAVWRGEGRAGRANPAPAAAAGGGTPTPATAPSETPSPDKATPGTKKVGVDIVRATGTSHRDLILRLIQQVSEAGPALAHAEGDRNGDLAATLAALEGIAPQNELEGMLAVQMVSTHNAAMACLRRAMIPKQTAEERDLNLKHATKLMSLYVQQVEALDKRRGKGQQKITVEHVNVHAGGQAIVGNVEAPARSAATPSPRHLQNQSVDGSTSLGGKRPGVARYGNAPMGCPSPHLGFSRRHNRNDEA